MPLEAIAKMRNNISANEKINFAVIGCKGQGWSNMRSILKNSEANCIGLCDVDKDVLDNRSNDVEKITGKKPKLYGDYRKMLENKLNINKNPLQNLVNNEMREIMILILIGLVIMIIIDLFIRISK